MKAFREKVSMKTSQKQVYEVFQQNIFATTSLLSKSLKRDDTKTHFLKNNILLNDLFRRDSRKYPFITIRRAAGGMNSLRPSIRVREIGQTTPSLKCAKLYQSTCYAVAIRKI